MIPFFVSPENGAGTDKSFLTCIGSYCNIEVEFIMITNLLMDNRLDIRTESYSFEVVN